MNYSFNTPIQMRAQLRALRQERQLTQAQVGKLMGLSQKRIARIESAPHRTSLDQIVQLTAALGYQLTLIPLSPSKSANSVDW
jgi:HTH-type transcriptional regulator / antitoxin HipB